MAIEAAAGLTGGCQCGAVRYRTHGQADRRQRLPLPNVPKSRRRTVHDLRRRAAGGICGHPWRDLDFQEFGHRRARLLRAMRDPVDLSRLRRRPRQRDAGQSGRSERSGADRATRHRSRKCAGFALLAAPETRDRAMACAEEDRRTSESRSIRSRSVNAARLAPQGEQPMGDAFIYDHVRTPRGRGKPDGSLHTASTLQSGGDGAESDQGSQQSRSARRRRRRHGLRRSGRRSRRRHRRGWARSAAGFGSRCRRADQPLLRLRPRTRSISPLRRS